MGGGGGGANYDGIILLSMWWYYCNSNCSTHQNSKRAGKGGGIGLMDDVFMDDVFMDVICGWMDAKWLCKIREEVRQGKLLPLCTRLLFLLPFLQLFI